MSRFQMHIDTLARNVTFVHYDTTVILGQLGEPEPLVAHARKTAATDGPQPRALRADYVHTSG